MIVINKRIFFIFTFVIIILIIAGFLRTLTNYTPLISATLSSFTFITYISFLLAWGISINKRIVHRKIKNALLLIAALMIFWILIRTCKHKFF